MKKNLLFVILTIFCLCFVCTACSVNVTTTVTDNDNSTSNVKDGIGTYERNFDRTINGNKYSFYVYAASDDQYKPDQSKIDAVNLAFLYNITTNDFKIKSAEGKSPISNEQAQKIADYIENHKVTWEQAVEVFDKMLENLLKGEENIENGLEFPSKTEEDIREEKKSQIGLDDIEINTMDADGNGIVERAFKKTINGDTIQFYYYTASTDQPQIEQNKVDKANVTLQIDSSTGKFHAYVNFCDKLSKEELERISSEISSEASTWEDVATLFEEKVLAILNK